MRSATYMRSSSSTTAASSTTQRSKSLESKTPKSGWRSGRGCTTTSTELQKAIREREIIAQRDRRNASRRGSLTPQAIAAELWTEHRSSLNLLQFPDDFVGRFDEWDTFDLPSGGVEAGEAMVDVGGLLRAGTIRVGGREGEVIDVGSVSRARFLEALSLCHREGEVRLPPDEVCDDAIRRFEDYRQELRGRCTQLAELRTSNQNRQRSIVEALLRKALQWTRE